MDDLDGRCNHHVIEVGGYNTCTRCGTCFSQVIVNQTPRIFLDRASRIQNNTLPMLDKRQSTIIKINDFENARQVGEWMRKIKHNYYYANDCKDSAHKSAFDLISSTIKLKPDVKDMTWILLKIMAKSNAIRGHCLHAMIKACVYVASEIQPKSTIFIGELVTTNKEMRKVYVCLRTVNAVLLDTKYERKRVSLRDLIWRIGNLLDVETRLILRSIALAKEAIVHGFLPLGKKPAMIAGCFLYIVSIIEGVKLEQSKVSKIVQATEITLRERIKEVLSVLPLRYLSEFNAAKGNVSILPKKTTNNVTSPIDLHQYHGIPSIQT